MQNGIGDIRLAAIDGDGTLSNSFISSIAQASGNGTEIGATSVLPKRVTDRPT